MKTLGLASVRSGGPTLGRHYVSAHPNDRLEGGFMAKAIKALWEGLTTGSSGTYIRPHETGGYSFGRWAKCKVTGGYRFTHLGTRASLEACREALDAVDKAAERRSRELNKRGKRRG